MPVLNLLRSKAYIYRIVKVSALATLLLFLFTGFFGCGNLHPVSVAYSGFLDGKAWEGPLKFTVEHQAGLAPIGCYSESHRTDTFKSINQTGKSSRFGVTTSYVSGGPAGAIFMGLFYYQEEIDKQGEYPSQQFIDGKSASKSYSTSLGTKKTTGCGPYGYDVSYGFVFRSPRTVDVNATLDGKPWSGPVAYSLKSVVSETVALAHIKVEKDLVHSYSVTKTREGTYSPQTYNDEAGDIITLTYVSGGPPKASLGSISPSELALKAGESGTITMNFISNPDADHDGTNTVPTDNITLPPVSDNSVLNVTATLDGQPWQGPLSYSISGAQTLTGTSAPQDFTNLKDGAYYAAYVSGGPENAQLSSTSVLGTSIVGSAAGLTFDFVSRGSITVNGLIGSSPWSGNCRYAIDGPVQLSGDHVPFTLTDLPLGRYTITYISGGPENYGFNGVVPQTLELTADAAGGIFKIYFIHLVPIAAAGADLGVTIGVSNATPPSSANVIYTITVTNAGPLDTTGVTVSFPVGALTYVSDTGAGAYNSATGVWTIGNMASGTTVTLSVTLSTGSWTMHSTFTHTATIIASSATDSLTSNNSASVTIVIH